METSDQTAAADNGAVRAGVVAVPDDAVRTAWDALPEPLLAFNAALQIVFVNRTASKYLSERSLPLDSPGLCNAIRVFDSSQNLLPPEQFPAARALRGETVERIEYIVRPSRQGSCVWVECSAHPMRDPEGNISGSVSAPP